MDNWLIHWAGILHWAWLLSLPGSLDSNPLGPLNEVTPRPGGGEWARQNYVLFSMMCIGAAGLAIYKTKARFQFVFYIYIYDSPVR